MTQIGPEDLASWRDPDALLDTLHQLGKRVDAGERPGLPLREATLALLEHEDPDIRDEALRLLLVALKDTSARSAALAMVRSDENNEVRGTAAFGIAAVSSAATQREDIELLLQILLDERESNDIRGCAYEALLIIHRRPKFPPLNREFDPAKDVDWGWIEELRRGAAEASAGS